MRSRVFFRVLIILACVGLTLSQKENLGLFWREYYSLGRDFKVEDNSLEPHHLLIEAKIAKYDPEAALIVKTALMRSEGEKLVEVLAGGILSYPDNEFFLYRLVRLLLQPEMGIDPQIILKFADRLIAIKPDNAPYHYLKAYVLFRNRKGDDYGDVLREIELANHCPDYIFPYDYYNDRIVNLVEKVGLSNILLGRLPCPGWLGPFASELHKNLLRLSQQAFADGKNNIGMHLGDISREMIRRQVKGQDQSFICHLNIWRLSLMSGFNSWGNSQELELQRATLSVERASQNRLELCSLLNIKNHRKKAEAVGSEPARREKTNQSVFAAAPAVHCGRMFIVYLLLWLVLSIICLFRGYRPARLKWSVIAGFFGVSAFYFCLTQGLFLYSHTSLSGCHFSYVDAFLFKSLDLDDILEDPLFWLFLVAPILVGIVLWSLGRNHKVRGFIFKNRWRKIFWIIPLSTLALGYLSYLARGYMYLRYVPMTLFVIFTALLLIYSPTERVSWYKVIYKIITSKDTQTIRLRSRILQLTGYFAVLYWLSLLFLAPATARSIKHCTGWYATYPPSTECRLPEADEHIYQRVLDQFDKENLIKWEIHGLLGIVMPDDLPAVLRKLNTMKFSNPWDRMGMMPGPMSVNKKAILKEEEKIGLCDKDLIHIMKYCGRDVVEIIVDFMDNPESERALIGRAKLGDRSVRGKLKALWDSRKQDNFRFRSSSSRFRPSFFSRQCGLVDPNCGAASELSVRAYGILSGLACVCEPDEAAGYFLDYIDMDMTPGCDIHYDYEFFRNLRLLPSAQVREVLKAYLIKSKKTAKINDERPAWTQFPHGMMPSGMTMLPRDVSIGMDIILRPLDNISDLYGNRKLAEMIFTIILSSSHYSESMGAWGIAPYFDSEFADLLRKGLSARDENLRAWCVCQLGRTGYKWHKEELEKLFMDKSWKVRANAMMAGGKKSAAVSRDDRHAFVRLVGHRFYAEPMGIKKRPP